MVAAKKPKGTIRSEETKRLQVAFLASYAKLGRQNQAAVLANISPRTVRDWMQGDINRFKERYEDAHRDFVEHLEEIAMGRIENPGHGVGSDLLLITLLNKSDPEHYRPHPRLGSEAGREVMAVFKEAVKAEREKAAKEKTLEGMKEAVENPRDLVRRALAASRLDRAEGEGIGE